MKFNINNERGGMAALLSVIVLSLIMVTTLTSFYTYLENRARFQERLRINYQIGYVMDDISRVLVEAREQFLADATCGNVPSSIRFIDCTQVCAPSTAGLGGTVPAGTPSNALCVRNDSLNKIVNNADFFCAFNTEGNGGQTAPSYCAGLIAQNDSEHIGGSTMIAVNEEKSKIRNWYGRLDNFFDTTIVRNAPRIAGKMYPILEARIQPPTLLGWMLPQTAFAGYPGGGDPPPTEIPLDPPKQQPPIDYPKEQPPTQPGGPSRPPVIGGPTPPAPAPTPTVEACNDNVEMDGCAAHCSRKDSNAGGGHAFCKNSQALTRIALVGGDGCSAANTDPHCKRCSGAERQAGGCLKLSICPPWVPSEECTSANRSSDKRLHQMVRVATNAATTPPVVPVGAPVGWGSCPDECLEYGTSPSCVSQPVQGGCRVACSGNGVIYYMCR